MSILERLPDDPQREIELLRELVKAKDALIAELSKRPIASPPVYVPYSTPPRWDNGPWSVTSATTNGDAIGGKTAYRDGSVTTWGVLIPK